MTEFAAIVRQIRQTCERTGRLSNKSNIYKGRETLIVKKQKISPCVGRMRVAAVRARGLVAQSRMRLRDCRWAARGIPGARVAPATIHTYRKATVFGRIVAESPQDLHRQIRGLATESPVFGAPRQKRAQILLQQNRLDDQPY
jgi:hypothetical protein